MRSPREPNLAPLLEAASPPYAECGFVCDWDYHDGIVHYGKSTVADFVVSGILKPAVLPIAIIIKLR